jgi:hypothetical protein
MLPEGLVSVTYSSLADGSPGTLSTTSHALPLRCRLNSDSFEGMSNAVAARTLPYGLWMRNTVALDGIVAVELAACSLHDSACVGAE